MLPIPIQRQAAACWSQPNANGGLRMIRPTQSAPGKRPEGATMEHTDAITNEYDDWACEPARTEQHVDGIRKIGRAHV